MEAYTDIYGPLSIYSAIASIVLVILGVQLYRIIKERKILIQQRTALEEQVIQRDQTIAVLEEENAMLAKQVVEQDQIIEEQSIKIDGLKQIVAEQANKLKQYESFFANLREAQAKEKARAAMEGVPVEEIRIEPAKPTVPSASQSGSKSSWIMGSMMVARVLLLLTTGIPV